MQLASRGDYERHKFSQVVDDDIVVAESALDQVANSVGEQVVEIPLVASEPEVSSQAETPEPETQEPEVVEKQVFYVKQFPVPPNTPNKIDHVKHIKPWLKQRRTIFALWAASFTVFVVGSGITIYSVIQNDKIIDQISGGSGEVAGIAGGPSEGYSASEDIPDLGAHIVAAHMPRYISIPKYNTKGRVFEVGVTAENKMDVPKNVHDGGWYNSSILPGSGAGASVISGHVSGYTQPGIFYNLKNLNPGDQITVELGSGKLLNYEVVSKKTVTLDQFNILDVLNPAVPGSEGLNLITCGGQFDSASQNYLERVLVFTKRV